MTIDSATAAQLDLLSLPHTGTPWGAVWQGDQSSVDPMVALRAYAGELAWLLRVKDVYDPLTGLTVDVLVSTHGYHTGGDGAGAIEGLDDWEHFPPGLINPGSMSSSVLSGGTVAPGALPTYGSLVIGNADRRFDAMKRYRMRRREFQVWVGPAAWMGPTFTEFAEDRSGVIEDVSWGVEQITLSTRGPDAAFRREVNENRYLGFGPCAELTASGDYVSLDAGSYNPTSVHWRVMVRAPSPLVNGVLISYGGWTESVREGLEVRITPDGGVLWVIDDYDLLLVTPGGLITPGGRHRVSLEGGAGGTAIYVDGVLAASNSAAYVRSAHIDEGTDVVKIGSR